MINVVAALIIDNDKFLIAQRATGELKGLWEFPGGKIENNEDKFSAIIREIKEELGLKIIPVKIINTYTYKYTFANVKLSLIRCTIPKGQKIESDGSHTNLKWISINDRSNKEFAPLDNNILESLAIFDTSQ